MIDEEKFFEDAAFLAKNHSNKSIEMIFTYVNGEQETFETDMSVMGEALIKTKERKEYFYIQHTLINMKNVIKIKFNLEPDKD